MCRGDYSLGRTFWLFGICGVALSVVAWLVVAALDGAFDDDTAFFLGVPGALAIALCYWTMWSVGVFRSAGPYNGPVLWSLIGRVVAVLVVLANVAMLAVVALLLVGLSGMPH